MGKVEPGGEPLTAGQREAVRLLGVYTAGQFRLWDLAGPEKGTCRAHVLSTLAGVRVSKSRAGVNALRDALYDLARPAGNCPAQRDDAFRAWARGVMACG